MRLRAGKYFSLVEIVVVIAMIVLISALAVGRIGAAPVAASLDKAVAKIEHIFAEAFNQAALRGRSVTVVYASETREFRILQEENSFSGDYLARRFATVGISDPVEVEIPQACTELRFESYPDGSVSGPDIVLKSQGTRLRLTLSPLTGRILRESNRGKTK